MLERQKAFTLIELLVVIAIISLLSSVVLASLSNARSEARASSILSNLNSARTQATLYYNDNGSYIGLCADSKIVEILEGLKGVAEGAACFEAVSNNHGVWIEGVDSVLAKVDWGIGVKSDDAYFAASPLGVGTFAASPESAGTDWQNAKSLCAAIGGRLASPSAMAALYQIDSVTPSGFSTIVNWTGLESGAPSSQAWEAGMYNGDVGYGSQSVSHVAHCIL